jgi:hypothetical protein
MSYETRAVFDVINSYGELGCTKPDLVKETLGMTRDKRKDCLDDLVDAGLVVYKQIKKGTYYLWATKYYKGTI